jgi:hypothetical protein
MIEKLSNKDLSIRKKYTGQRKIFQNSVTNEQAAFFVFFLWIQVNIVIDCLEIQSM